MATTKIDLVPGTEVVRVTDESHHHVDLLEPRPSADPHDPLNWSRSWKSLAIVAQAVYCFIGVMTSLSIAPMYPLLAAEFELNGTQLDLLTGAAVLLLGYSNFIVVPVANVFGRRFVTLVLGALAFGTSIWEARSESYKVLLAARIVNGFAVSTTESLMVQVVADLFFLHERGLWMGVYFTSFFCGLFIGPTISGSIAARHGWRSYFWLSTALTAFSFAVVSIGFPETKWYRDSARLLDQPMLVTSDAAVASTVASAVSNNEEDDQEKKPAQSEMATVSHAITDLAAQQTLYLHKGRPARAAYKVVMRPDSAWKSFLFRDVITCARIFFYPIVLWAALCLAGPANLLLHWNITESGVLSAPPHNFGVASVGYANLSFLVGGLAGLASAGPLSDWYARRMTARNGGVREPEFRLPMLLPYFVVSIVGIVVGGIAEQRGWPWPWILVVGYGLTGVCTTGIPTITTAYAVDSYKTVSGEIMVVATVFKNTCGFGMSYWVPDLTAREGFLTPVMVQFALVIGPVLFAVPLFFWGKTLRRWTRHSRVHQLKGHSL